MAPQYKFTYLDTRGLGEMCRYLFKYGGIDFEDVRIKRENWPQHKDKTPFGVVPILEYNGKVVGQSLAIARYLAKKVKLVGDNDWESLEIDATADTINDIRIKLIPIIMEQDTTKKQALLETLKKDTFGYYLPRLEAGAQKNNGYLVLGRLTWADFYFSTVSTMFDIVTGEDILGSYPNLKGVRDKVHALPAIKKWIEVRPKSDF
ncbi:hypothetical protein Zmor_007739 [Zophobas morio]|uniref:glutathione transferase n=1 Tax=Zophobas morio TaxID=2755281 RepID=A0AA38IY55_9CUCU|nr:hypothetical protein Zmor_007739 [Zophobas morio]